MTTLAIVSVKFIFVMLVFLGKCNSGNKLPLVTGYTFLIDLADVSNNGKGSIMCCIHRITFTFCNPV